MTLMILTVFQHLFKPIFETVSEELVTVQGRGSIVFFRKIKIKKLSLSSCTIIKITFCKPSYNGAELCGSHVFYFFSFTEHSYKGDYWVWY